MTVCIFGGSGDNVDTKYIDACFALGKAVGTCGATLLYGGGTGGCMAAAARGSIAVGGKVIAVAVDSIEGTDVPPGDTVTVVVTKNIDERKEKMQADTDVYVALPGGTGTLDEFFSTLTAIECGFLRGKIVLFNAYGFYDTLIQWLRESTERGFVRDRVWQAFTVCDTVQDIQKLLF